MIAWIVVHQQSAYRWCGTFYWCYIPYTPHWGLDQWSTDDRELQTRHAENRKEKNMSYKHAILKTEDHELQTRHTENRKVKIVSHKHAMLKNRVRGDHELQTCHTENRREKIVSYKHGTLNTAKGRMRATNKPCWNREEKIVSYKHAMSKAEKLLWATNTPHWKHGRIRSSSDYTQLDFQGNHWLFLPCIIHKCYQRCEKYL